MISNVSKCPASLLCSMEAKVRHQQSWALTIYKLSMFRQMRCKPAISNAAKGRCVNPVKEFAHSFVHEQQWKKGLQPAGCSVPICCQHLMLHCLLLITSTSPSGSAEQSNPVCLENSGLGNCLRANKSSAHEDLIHTVLDTVLVEDLTHTVVFFHN